MATKKPAAKAPAAKKPGTALTLWEQEMAGAAAAQASKEEITGSFKSISMKGGILSVDDNPVDDNEMNVVIIAAVHENQFYLEDYDPSTPASPACYAFGETDDGMTPHENSQDKQNDSCDGCPNNEWGSADKGRGKACKNVRRLLCVSADAIQSAEDLAEAEARLLKLPVMSVKNWSTYVKNTLGDDIKRPYYGVVTRIKVVPDAKSQFKVQFHFEELIDFDDELYAAMKKKVAEAEKNIINPYPVFEPEDKPQRGARGKTIPIKKAAPAKKAGKY